MGDDYDAAEDAFLAGEHLRHSDGAWSDPAVQRAVHEHLNPERLKQSLDQKADAIRAAQGDCVPDRFIGCPVHGPRCDVSRACRWPLCVPGRQASPDVCVWDGVVSKDVNRGTVRVPLRLPDGGDGALVLGRAEAQQLAEYLNLLTGREKDRGAAFVALERLHARIHRDLPNDGSELPPPGESFWVRQLDGLLAFADEVYLPLADAEGQS